MFLAGFILVFPHIFYNRPAGCLQMGQQNQFCLSEQLTANLCLHSPFSQIDMIPNIPTYEDAYPSSEYMQLSLIDPLLFKSEQEARDRTPSLTAMSTTSSVYEQPLDDSLDLGFVSPRVLFRSPPRDSQWQDQEFMFSAPSAKRHCAPGQMIPVKSESECNLFDRAVMKAELESMTVPSATTLYGQIQPSFGTNDLKRRHE